MRAGRSAIPGIGSSSVVKKCPPWHFFTRSKLSARDAGRALRVATRTYALLQSAVGHPVLPSRVVKSLFHDPARKTALLLAACALFGQVLCGQKLGAEETERSRVDEINAQVEEQKALLEETKSRYRNLESELKDLRTAIKELRLQQGSIEQEIDRTQGSKSQVADELRVTEGRIDRLKEQSLKRLRSFYMHRAAHGVQGLILMVAHDSRHLARNSIYLARIQAYDHQLLKELALLQTERQVRQAELERLLKQHSQLQEKLKTQAKVLQGKISRQEGVLNGLKAEQARIQEFLTALRAQALRLETVVASITGGPKGGREEQPANVKAASGQGAASHEPFSGLGLKKLKGRLSAPVSGRVLRSYGKQKLAEFEEIVLSKGLEFQAAAGSEVQAISAGRVIFAGRMPGYGTVLIVDHGQRWYSLYGRVAKVQVQVGQDVERGTLIGQTGELDEKGRNFYFEIRENGKPVNPRDYLGSLVSAG